MSLSHVEPFYLKKCYLKKDLEYEFIFSMFIFLRL